MTDANKTCFIIAPIGDPDSEIRKRSDQIFKYVFEPAAKECGYEAIRADHITEPGMITSQVIQHIIDDPIVLADLTGKNPNVFYELAIRHAIRKPYAQIIEAGERIPFDVAGLRTIDVNHHDLDSVDFAKREIIKQIKSMLQEGYEVNSPISITMDLDILRRSDIPEKRQLADVLTAINDLKSEFISFKIDSAIDLKEIRELKRFRNILHHEDVPLWFKAPENLKIEPICYDKDGNVSGVKVSDLNKEIGKLKLKDD